MKIYEIISNEKTTEPSKTMMLEPKVDDGCL